jgi:hypothetical protein
LRVPSSRTARRVFRKSIRKLAAFEGGLPVRRRGDDKNDVLARRDSAVAVDDGEPGQRPALGGLSGNTADLGSAMPG